MLKPTTNQLHWGLFNTYRSELMGIACFWIMLHHNFIHWSSWARPIRLFLAFGGCGVDIFLLLSGMGLYQSWNKKPSLSLFYKRRLFRLFFPYCFLGLPFWLIYDLIIKKGNFFFDLCFISFPLQGEHTFWFIPAIAVFYFLFPLLYAVIFKSSDNQLYRSVILIWTTLIISIILWKLMPNFYKNTGIALTRTGVFIMGIYLGSYVSKNAQFHRHTSFFCLIFCSSLILLIKTVPIPALWMRFFYLGLSLALCILCINLLSLNIAPHIRAFFHFLGTRSLELYILHIAIKRMWNITPLFRLSFDPSRTIEYLSIILFALLAAFPAQKLTAMCTKKFLNNSNSGAASR